MSMIKTPLLALALFAAMMALTMPPAVADDEPQIPDDAAQYMIQVQGMV